MSPAPSDPLATVEAVLPRVGEPGTLELRSRILPAPGLGQAIVQVEATGVSFAEQQMRLGKYYDQPKFPFVPGYDLVGTVERLGGRGGETRAGVAVGDRVAALTKTGAWAERVLLDAEDLVPVPDGLDPVSAETVIVNGVTAWRMLHRAAKVPRGGTVVVLGAAGGVGSVLVQMARRIDCQVIGVVGPSQLDAVRALGATAIDYRSEDVPARVAELAPAGAHAVFDHVGGSGITASWSMVRRGGTLVSYGTAATKDALGNSRLPVLKLIARLVAWQVLPNGRRATFFNLWAGHRRRDRFRAELRRDLATVFALVQYGHIRPSVAGRFSLADVADALRFAEQGGLTGKVIILPGG